MSTTWNGKASVEDAVTRLEEEAQSLGLRPCVREGLLAFEGEVQGVWELRHERVSSIGLARQFLRDYKAQSKRLGHQRKALAELRAKEAEAVKLLSAVYPSRESWPEPVVLPDGPIGDYPRMTLARTEVPLAQVPALALRAMVRVSRMRCDLGLPAPLHLSPGVLGIPGVLAFAVGTLDVPTVNLPVEALEPLFGAWGIGLVSVWVDGPDLLLGRADGLALRYPLG